jgi:hypothetical protein
MKKRYDTETKTPTPFELKEGEELVVDLMACEVLLQSGEVHTLPSPLFCTVFPQFNRTKLVQSKKRFSKPVLVAHVIVRSVSTRRLPYRIKAYASDPGREPRDSEEFAEHHDQIRATQAERLRPKLGSLYLLDIVE